METQNTEKSAGVLSNEAVAREIYKKVVEGEAKLASADKGRFETNCNFRYSESGATIDLRSISNTDKLISIAKFLLQQRNLHKEACEEIGVKSSEPTWLSVSIEKWLNDVKIRTTQINYVERKAAIERLKEKALSLAGKDFIEVLKLEALKSEIDFLGDI